MDREEILDKVRSVVVDQLNVEEDEVVDDAFFVDDLGADDLGCVEICMAIEEEFGISIPDEDAAGLFEHGNVADLVSYIQANA